MPRGQSLEERLRSKLVERGDCLEFSGARCSGNYGAIRHEGRTQMAHRLMWEIAYGAIPKGHYVIHRCGNRACCRSEHLALATATEIDRSRKDFTQANGLEGENEMSAPDHSGENIFDHLALEEEAKRRGISVTQLRMLKATPNSVVFDLVDDAFRSNPVTGQRSIAKSEPVQKGSGGWVEPTPLRSPPGQVYIEQQLDAQDTLDKIDKLRRLRGV
jgi:hypothetical protein